MFYVENSLKTYYNKVKKITKKVKKIQKFKKIKNLVKKLNKFQLPYFSFFFTFSQIKHYFYSPQPQNVKL